MIDNSSRVPDSLLSRRIRQMVALDPGAPALFFDGLTFPWSFYSDAVADLATLLAAHPAARRVGIVLRNRPGPLAALIATLGTGREVVTLSPHLGDIGLERDIVDLAPDVIVAEDEDWARDAVLVSSKAVGAIALRTGADRGLAAQPVSWSPSPSLRDPRDVAVLMMTSGTTGRPKRVELTYDRMTAAFRAAGLVFDEAHEPRLRSRTDILWASLAHISGLYFAVAHVVEGRSVALLEKFEVGAWVELVSRHRPGYVRLAPTALRMVLQAEVPAETFASVRAVGSGTAPLPPELAEAFEERYGIPVLGTYGATEFAGRDRRVDAEGQEAVGTAQARQRRARPPRHRAARRRPGDRRRAPGRPDRPARGARRAAARGGRRLAAHHRPRHHRRRPVPVHPRPGGRRDQPGRLQDPAQRDRGRAGRAPGGRRGLGRRAAGRPARPGARRRR